MIQGGIIAHLIWHNPFFILLATALSAVPDLGRLLQENPKDWNKFYYEAHRLTLRNLLIPFWNIHIIEDHFMHRKEGGWKWWGYLLEIILDISFAIYVYYA